jgi:urea carboxylase
MFDKVLIANRGAIATRILRTLKRMGVEAVAVYSDADAYAPHVMGADQRVRIGAAAAGESYLSVERILDAARATGAQAIHPGYGFLSENAAFAEACEAAGLVFLGPTPQQMRDFGLKHTARAIARQSGVPLLPGTELLADVEEALQEAGRIGYPVMLKSTAGGGGIGMRRCASPDELAAGYEVVARLAQASFKDGGLYLEKLVRPARHVEVQIFGDGAGKVLALGERDCSLQRRNQKVVEETPAPGLAPATRAALLAAARQLGESARYRSAGTVEFVLDAASGAFYFLEVNTRIQVEHGITEEVTGVDLVEWMVRLGAGTLPDLDTLAPAAEGAAIEVRLYAEDPARGFRPSGGVITHASFPPGIRVETWVEPGTEVTSYYDPMVAKLIARGRDRAEAIDRLAAAVATCRIDGIETNRAYLTQVLASPGFRAGAVHTGFLDDLATVSQGMEVVEPGTQTTVQDWPGRRGHWDVGVPPSGPMDPLSFRLANRLVCNPSDAAGLECTLTGPTLRFRAPAVVALTGADMGAEIDGRPVARFAALAVPAGAVMKMGAVRGPGSRAYLAVRGGFDVPLTLGSRATFTLGLFGGHAGRALRAGDVVPLAPQEPGAAATLPRELIPPLGSPWEIAVLLGPQAAPDFFTPQDIETFFAADWKVHYNSSRTGVRLVGPKPAWARKDGGEAGLHPSNIHDNAYAVGTIDFTGDMPVILGPDGPSLGGFVCPATIVEAELWKVGQLKAGDTVRWRPVSLEEARRMRVRQEGEIGSLVAGQPLTPTLSPADRGEGAGRTDRGEGGGGDRKGAVLVQREDGVDRPSITVRQDGDAAVLVEYGAMVLDLDLRFRVHALMRWLRQRALPGIIDLTPGIRSLHVHYDDAVLPRERLLAELAGAEDQLPQGQIEVPSRIVHLPLSWDDPATRLAIARYMQSVRPDAPWCPSNIEFIRRINGLSTVDEVREIVFAASYLVLGLGDVYLGAPVATPIDPRHRLVTTKYNPARTWTPENAVGIGGAYLCVYGMEGPGGYQFVGRTCQMWNRHMPPGGRGSFVEGRPWLLRFFDQIRFYPVSETELLQFRADFPHGRATVAIEPTTFRLADYRAFLAAHRPSIEAFKRRQQEAFEAERERWAALPPPPAPPEAEPDDAAEPALGPGEAAVRAEVTGSVWQVMVAPGQRVAEGDRLLVLETMKMETPVPAPAAGIVRRIAVRPGALVTAGQVLLILVES